MIKMNNLFFIFHLLFTMHLTPVEIKTLIDLMTHYVAISTYNDQHNQIEYMLETKDKIPSLDLMRPGAVDIMESGCHINARSAMILVGKTEIIKVERDEVNFIDNSCYHLYNAKHSLFVILIEGFTYIFESFRGSAIVQCTGIYSEVPSQVRDHLQCKEFAYVSTFNPATLAQDMRERILSFYASLNDTHPFIGFELEWTASPRGRFSIARYFSLPIYVRAIPGEQELEESIFAANGARNQSNVIIDYISTSEHNFQDLSLKMALMKFLIGVLNTRVRLAVVSSVDKIVHFGDITPYFQFPVGLGLGTLFFKSLTNSG